MLFLLLSLSPQFLYYCYTLPLFVQRNDTIPPNKFFLVPLHPCQVYYTPCILSLSIPLGLSSSPSFFSSQDSLNILHSMTSALPAFPCKGRVSERARESER